MQKPDKDITIDEAWTELVYNLSSEQDPIKLRGRYTTLDELGDEFNHDLGNQLSWDDPAKKLRLGFHGKNSDGTVTYRNSNLFQMLVDRQEWHHDTYIKGTGDDPALFENDFDVQIDGQVRRVKVVESLSRGHMNWDHVVVSWTTSENYDAKAFVPIKDLSNVND